MTHSPMKPFRPQKIYIEKAARGYPLTRTILDRFKEIPYEEIDAPQALVQKIKITRDPIGEGKKFLLLERNRGRSFKPFPESEDYLSCDYFTLHLAEGCDLECSYCILQAYLTNPLLTVYVNVEEMLADLEGILRANPDKFFRIGTGQLADSLSLDPMLGLSEILVPFFARQENAVLELKTKTNFIDRLLNLDPEGRTIISWSMNSKRIEQQEEHKCASIDERIAAAEKIARTKGYRAGFHFDPIIDYPGWEAEYGEILDRIFREIPHEKIAWISLGCLRFMPELKPIIQARFPKSQLALGEWLTGMDGKMRYLKSRRIEIYRRMLEMIRRQATEVTLYLSMESPEVWRRVLGKTSTKSAVCELLDRAGKKLLRPSSPVSSVS